MTRKELMNYRDNCILMGVCADETYRVNGCILKYTNPAWHLVRYEGDEEEVDLSELCDYVDDGAFEDNLFIRKINLGSVISVKDKAFAGAKNLEEVKGESVIFLGPTAFFNCVRLRNVRLDSLINIEMAAAIRRICADRDSSENRFS